MKRTLRYQVNQKQVEREINYIPVRYIIAMMITIFEILAIIATVVACCYWIPYFYIAAFLTEVFCVLRIVASDDNPDYKVPWLLVVLLIPIAGFMLYFLFYSRKLKPKFLRRLAALKAQRYQKENRPTLERLGEESEVACRQAQMLCQIADAALFTDTAQTYFPLGEDMHKQMLCDLQTAENFIFLEYFIIEEGVFWNSILTILEQKAGQGVLVRVLYDDIGCMSTLPGNYAKLLAARGIEATPFSRLRGNADSEFNNRSHRKILVIDGKIGYTGGVNLADEYINEIERFGHWKDTGVRLEGEAVWELTHLFCVDFGLQKKQAPKLPKELYPAHPVPSAGYVIPFGDGPKPMYRHHVSKSVIRNLLSCATRYVYITTPYLILDHETCACLEEAALRGVDVRLIVPHIPDKKIVFDMTRSYYSRLMEQGVRIYEYTPGFIHAKSYLCDGEYAMIGTVNLDYRSLIHHFENGVWMYRCECLADLRADFEATLAKSEEVTSKQLRRGPLQRFFRAIVRIFAPLL